MSRSRAKRGSGGAGGGGRLKTVGLFVTLLAVAALVGSLVAGLWWRGGPSSDRPPVVEEARPSAGAPVSGQRVRVEVLNASGINGLANEGRRVLRDRGFDVVEIGNAPREFGPDTSLVLDRAGSIAEAGAVADSLGLRRVVSRPDSACVCDVTVILGKDWRAAAPGGPR
jgi:LytR cell envelope-related transcriptional attenuator